jgi:hypothetical protein
MSHNNVCRGEQFHGIQDCKNILHYPLQMINILLLLNGTMWMRCNEWQSSHMDLAQSKRTLCCITTVRMQSILVSILPFILDQSTFRLDTNGL